jgi:hypothetical protein
MDWYIVYNSKGIYYWSDGRKFAGQWLNSKMNGIGIFYWNDGRSYKGEYKDDKKNNFGIYLGNEGKRYDGFWEDGVQKNLGKYTKKDGSFKLGYWEDNHLTKPITNDKDIAIKLSEIDMKTDEISQKLECLMDEMKNLFSNFLPNIQFESLLSI